MALLLWNTIGACAEPCTAQKEPIEGANLPFEHEDLVAALAGYAPTEIRWEGEGPSGAATDPVSVQIEPEGAGYVWQYRRPDGSICGGEAIAEYLPVVVSLTIGAGAITTNSLSLILTAQSTSFSDMNLYNDENGQPAGYAFDATVDPGWADACARTHPDAFTTAPERFWLEFNDALDPLGVVIFGYGAEDGYCWAGQILSTPA
ncbi:MAG: hypothetical protein Q8P18_01940 [Pseudomonadota bacterium]|nr:hypothetical protein [Pseudomonadota bacterium]